MVQVFRWKRDQKGQSLVEFALVLPLLLLLLLGIVDFGLLFFSYVTVNTAAREGARQGVVLVETRDSDRVKGPVMRVMDLMDRTDYPLVDALIVTVTDSEGENQEIYPDDTKYNLPSSGEELQVEVVYEYRLITPIGGIINILRSMFGGEGDDFPGTIPLTGRITMVME